MKSPQCCYSNRLALTLAVALCGCGLAAQAASTNLNPVADTTLFEHDPTNNLGGKLDTIVGRINSGDHSRALYQFDLEDILPTNATISAASLNLVVTSANGSGQSFRLHRVLKSWGEGVGSGGGGGSGGQGSPANPGEATWLARFDPSPTWDAGGGLSGSDYAATDSAAAVMSLSSLSFSDPKMVADLQNWRTNSSENFGWLLKIANENTIRTASHLGAREDAANAPILTIQYSVPAPVPTNPPNIFNTALAGNAITFSFKAQSNRTYRVEFRDSASGGIWNPNPLTNIPGLPSDTVVSITDTISATERYFRVRTP